MKKIILTFLVLFVTITFSYSQTEDADQQILEFDLAGFAKDGRKTWDVEGESADIFASVVYLNDVIAHLYGEDEDMTLTSDKGSLDKETGYVHLEDNVVAVSSSGGRLTSDSLDWDQRNQLISTEDIVNIERGSLTSVSKGAKAQPDLSKIYLNEDVTVHIQEEKDVFSMTEVVEDDNKPLVITCDGPLEIEYDKNIATFYNNVHVIESATSDIFCDRMVVEFDFGNKQINRVNAFDNVRIVKDGNTSYSDKAVYTSDDKKIVLTGSPKLIIYSGGDLNAAFDN